MYADLREVSVVNRHPSGVDSTYEDIRLPQPDLNSNLEVSQRKSLPISDSLMEEEEWRQSKKDFGNKFGITLRIMQILGFLPTSLAIFLGKQTSRSRIRSFRKDAACFLLKVYTLSLVFLNGLNSYWFLELGVNFTTTLEMHVLHSMVIGTMMNIVKVL